MDYLNVVENFIHREVESKDYTVAQEKVDNLLRAASAIASLDRVYKFETFDIKKTKDDDIYIELSTIGSFGCEEGGDLYRDLASISKDIYICQGCPDIINVRFVFPKM